MTQVTTYQTTVRERDHASSLAFFLYALWRCSPKYLKHEFNHMKRSFMRLHYSKVLLVRLKPTAIKILEAGPRER